MVRRQDGDQPVDREREDLQVTKIHNIGRDTNLDEPLCHRAHDGVARSLFDIDIDARVAQQELTQDTWQKLAQRRRVRLQANLALQAAGKLRQLAFQVLELPKDKAGMVRERTAGRRQGNTAPPTLEQLDSSQIFHFADTCTRGSECHVGLGRAVRNARGLGNAEKQLQIDEFEAHTDPGSLRLTRRHTTRFPDCLAGG